MEKKRKKIFQFFLLFLFTLQNPTTRSDRYNVTSQGSNLQVANLVLIGKITSWRVHELYDHSSWIWFFLLVCLLLWIISIIVGRMTTIIKYCTVVVRVKNFIITTFITTSINIGRITTNMMKEIGHLLL